MMLAAPLPTPSLTLPQPVPPPSCPSLLAPVPLCPHCALASPSPHSEPSLASAARAAPDSAVAVVVVDGGTAAAARSRLCKLGGAGFSIGAAGGWGGAATAVSRGSPLVGGSEVEEVGGSGSDVEEDGSEGGTTGASPGVDTAP